MLTHKQVAALSDSELVREFEAQVGFMAGLHELEGANCHCQQCSEYRVEIDWLRNALDARLAAGRKPRPPLERDHETCSYCGAEWPLGNAWKGSCPKCPRKRRLLAAVGERHDR